LEKISDFSVSSDKHRLNVDTIHGFLKRSDWAAKRTRETVVKSIDQSLCFGAYQGARQIGFMRVVTDTCTFAYLCDVFVDEEFRGLGISRRMLEAVLVHPDLQKLRRFVLATSSAHGLYEKFGFQLVPDNKFMEIKNDDV